jgi:hypothetical protein
VGGTSGGTRVDDLIQRLISVLEKEEKLSEWCDADTNRRHYGPYSRALKALKETFTMDCHEMEQVQDWEFH